MFVFILPPIALAITLAVCCVRVERHRAPLRLITVSSDGAVRTRLAPHAPSMRAFHAHRSVRVGPLDLHLGWYGI